MWPLPCNDGERQWNTHVGLDVSLKQTSFSVVDLAGLVLREGVVGLDPRGDIGGLA